MSYPQTVASSWFTQSRSSYLTRAIRSQSASLQPTSYSVTIVLSTQSLEPSSSLKSLRLLHLTQLKSQSCCRMLRTQSIIDAIMIPMILMSLLTVSTFSLTMTLHKNLFKIRPSKWWCQFWIVIIHVLHVPQQTVLTAQHAGNTIPQILRSCTWWATSIRRVRAWMSVTLDLHPTVR